MTGYLLVAAGAAVGAPLRYLTDRVIQARNRTRFPAGTLAVNLVGSALLGLITGLVAGHLLAGHAIAPQLQLAIGTGLCGALTTWSTLAFETVRLAQLRARLMAAGYLVGTIVLGLGAAALGRAAANWIS